MITAMIYLTLTLVFNGLMKLIEKYLAGKESYEVLTPATAKFYPAVYGYHGEAAELGYHAVMLTAAQLIFTGLVRVTNSFFYSVGKDKYSLFMIYFDPVIMTPLTLLILPRIFGLDGIWVTAVVTQFILNIVAFGMFITHEKEMKKMEASI